ncbi:MULTISPECIES: RbsD/FucU family protein [Paraburkholderia]|uniref:Ribose ABC transporter n=1 Tax=Paraburkholderia youngii TaxID=2782701 RepID=A0ABX2NI18_9BURK|nr:RbsD/FucU domain-containing protein [Paraburkholderia youngii]NUX53307.1 ribose ABC transporter [Paraburkholderia youngii]NVI03931.1 ribose ABC transporter [Paraburkholderia youngii]
MLKNLNPLLTGDLLSILASMGHGDELVIADANFPAAACARRLVELPGVAATEILDAVCSVFPLDDFVPNPAAVMRAPDESPEIHRQFEATIAQAEGRVLELELLDRFEFYERARAAFAVVASGERRLYGNIILKKGVVRL